MWALRRTAKSIRIYGYCVAATRASCVKPPETLSENADHLVSNDERFQLVADKSFLLKRVYHNQCGPVTFFMGNCNLSSQTGTKSSDDEDGFSELGTPLKDGFSKLEMPLETNVAEKIPVEENTDKFISEPDLSVDDSLEDDLAGVTHGELVLSDSETSTSGEKELQKKTLSSLLFTVIMNAPHKSIGDAITKWVEEGNKLGQTEIAHAMLNLLKSRMFSSALQLSEWIETNKTIEFTEIDYACRLNLMAKALDLHRAEKYINQIPESFRGELIYGRFLANCTQANNVKKAEEVFNKMRDLGFPLSAYACNQLLLLYKKTDWKKVADVLLMMEKENVKPTLFTYRLLVDAKGRANDITGMERVAETMKAEGIEPDFLIQSMMAKYYVYAGMNEKAESILEEMQDRGIMGNRCACKYLLTLYATLGKADQVERVWKKCEQRPWLGETLAAIEAWGKLGRVEKAEAVFEKMLKSSIKVSAKCYTALLKVYADHKLLCKGKDLVKHMADNGYEIGPYTWYALVKLYLEAGEVEKADSILQKATQQSQRKPLYRSYLAIFDKYAKRGDIHNAEKMFLRLRQCGYVNGLQQFQTLLQAYVNAKTPAYGFRERMKADNIFPNKTLAAQLAKIDSFNKPPMSELLD